MNMNIPRISITSDTDDTDLPRLNIQEAVTDIEDLDVPKQKKKRKRNKGKQQQQVVENDLTDVEDMQGSGDEMCTKIVSHANPINFEDLNADQGYIMESYISKSQKEFNQSNTHITKNTANERLFLKSDFDESEGLTDVEDIYASDDEASYGNSFPDTELPDEYDDNVVIDSAKNDMRKRSVSVSPSPCYSDCDSDTAKSARRFSNTKLLTATVLVGNILTDQELLSDFGDEVETKKVKKVRKRRPKGSMRNRGAVTDIEDVTLSIEEAKRSNVSKRVNRESKRKPFYQSESTLYFSDNEDCEFLEPTPRPKLNLARTLALPCDQDLGLTDVDDLDMSDIEEYKYDCTAIEKNIAMLTDACEEISEQAQPKVKLAAAENFDLDDLSDDDNHFFDIRFKTISKCEDTLRIPLNKPMGETDVEDLDSEGSDAIKVAYVKKISSRDTDIEDFSDDDFTLTPHKRQIKLPEIKRELVIIKENKTGKPTVVILPLDEHLNYERIAEAATDLEDFSEEDEEYLQLPCLSRRSSTPNVMQLDGGVVYDHQELKKLGDLCLEEALTDTEDLQLKNKVPLASKKIGPKLVVPGKSPRYNLCQDNTIDVEDLSDGVGNENKQIPKLKRVIPQCDGTTDIENFDASDDNSEVEYIYRPISRTPDQLRQIDSTYVVTMEGANKTEHLINISHRFENYSLTPNQTECEDMQASCEEDLAWYSDNSSHDIRKQLNVNCWSHVNTSSNSKMNMAEEAQYFRGGPLPQPLTDYESLDEEAVEVTEDYCAECLNTGTPEWDEPKPKALATESQGESSVTWQETSTTATTTTTSTSSQKAEDDEKKAEDESGTSTVRTTTTTTRTVTDQQHLTDEMQQLLKDMEEQIKK